MANIIDISTVLEQNPDNLALSRTGCHLKNSTTSVYRHEQRSAASQGVQHTHLARHCSDRQRSHPVHIDRGNVRPTLTQESDDGLISA
jgi:hypothetical protein